MSRNFLAILSVWSLLGWAAVVGAEPLQVAPQEGVLVLRAGTVLKGTITRAGDRYYVALPDAEIRIKATEVEMVCRDLEEAYRLKSGALGQGQAEERLLLADWCIRNELIGYAARELTLAREEDPRNPRLELVERRLRLAANPVEDLPLPPDAARARASAEELNQSIKGLPRGAVETFTSSIQPLLLNRCATGACHGPAAANPLRMERIMEGRPMTRSITHRNLDAVLLCIDFDDPAASPLLTKPIEPHGDAASAVLSKHDAQHYQLLVLWVHAIAQHRQRSKPQNVSRTAEPLLQKISDESFKAATPPATILTAAAEPTPAAESPAAEPAEADTLSEPRRLPQRGAPPAQPLAKDPFDPEIFNRQFLGK